MHVAGLIANSGPGFIRRVRPSEAGLPAPSLGYARAHGPLGCGCLPLWFGVGLSPSRMPFSSCFSVACYRKIRSVVRCAVHRAVPSCPGGTCTCAYARATAQQSSGNGSVAISTGRFVHHQLMSPNHPSQTLRSSHFVRMHTSPELSGPLRCADRGAAAQVHRSTS